MQETEVQSLHQTDPLEKEMRTHSSILAWEIPQTEKPVIKELDMTEGLNNKILFTVRVLFFFLILVSINLLLVESQFESQQ